MYIQELRADIEQLSQKKTDLYSEMITRYLGTTADEDMNDLQEDYDRAVRRLRKLLPDEETGVFNDILRLCEEKKRLCVNYAWKKGYELCRKMHSDRHVSFPFENDSVESYMKLYKLESLPAYRDLSEEITSLYHEGFKDGDFQHLIDDVLHFYADTEFEVLRAGCYLGYLEAVVSFSQTENGFVENRDMTLHFTKQMGDIPSIECETEENAKSNAEQEAAS